MILDRAVKLQGASAPCFAQKHNQDVTMIKKQLFTTILILIAHMNTSFIAAESMAPTQILIKNVHVWDGTSDGVTKKVSVLIERWQR